MASGTYAADRSAAGNPKTSDYRRFIPLREAEGAADRFDPERLTLAKCAWSDLDDLVRPFNRSVEEHVRMLAGQQWTHYHPVFGKFLDITEWMSQEERMWRQRPVFNRLMPFFILTHARMTENPPIITWVPGPDQSDAELAEALDVAFKVIWHDAEMEDVHDRLAAWAIVAGRAHTLSRIDPQGGPWREWIGRDLVPLVDANGQPIADDVGEPAYQEMEGVPFDKEGTPLAVARRSHDGATPELVVQGAPHKTRAGKIAVDVVSALNVRGSWGPTPWHQKRKHIIRTYHSVEDVYNMFGVEVAPDVRGGQISDIGEIERILYGTGFYQAVNSHLDNQVTAHSTEGYVELTQVWEAPCNREGMQETEENPGGRWLVTTRQQVIRDGARPAPFPHVSPLGTFEFARLPGRMSGTSLMEMMTPLQRSYNASGARIGEHAHLCANPKGIIDSATGLKPGQFTNRPGVNHIVNRRPGVPAIEYVAPPPLGVDAYRYHELLRAEMDDLGFMGGANEPAHPGDSGEKLKEERFNTDRYLGPTMRRFVMEYARMGETWRVMMPLIWDQETTLQFTGDDRIAQTLTVLPEMFVNGKVNARPDMESMLPEGRGEKQEVAYKMWREGGFGDPLSPAALAKFWENAHMPHLSRMARPGGVHHLTAEQENGDLALGMDPRSIPVFEWYDDETHLRVHEQFMASRAFLKLPPEVQDGYVLHRAAHLFNMQQKLLRAAAQAAALNPQPAPGAPGGGGGGGAKPANNKPAPGSGPSVRPGAPTPPRSQPQMPTASPSAGINPA